MKKYAPAIIVIVLIILFIYFLSSKKQNSVSPEQQNVWDVFDRAMGDTLN